MVNILLVEDDKNISITLSEFLHTEGFNVDTVSGQQEAVKKLSCNKYDIILLDISLQDGNGFSLCLFIKSKYNIPVIFLTASEDESSVVTGLDIGADDYIIKPFRPRELVSRIRSVLRRSSGGKSVFQVEDITIDTDRGTVSKNGTEIALSALEYRILLVF